MNRKKYISTALLLLAAVIWGFAFAAQDAASEIGAFTLGFARSIVGGIFLIGVVIVFDKLTGNGRRLFSRKGIDLNKYELIGGVIIGAVLVVASAFQQMGINSGTDGGKAAFITALYVVLVPVYALALKKRAPINVWISVAIAIVGFYLLCITENLTVAPSDLLVMACSLIFPIHILTIDHFSPKCDGIRMSMVQFFTAAVLNLAVALIAEGPSELGEIFPAIGPILFLGIGSSGIAYTLQILGQKDVNPAAASIILSLESVFGIIGTALFLGQTLSPREYLGCAVVLIAVILSQIDFTAIKSKIKKDEK
ncbi:MAG: DMT family transporter [Clostridia bacterium]|nr:DMT family transporter [Clostridia bacterium]